jgi:uncharacterized membrane protein YukC
MEVVKTIWNYFAGVLPPTAMLLLALLIWTKYEAFTMRKRVAAILDGKDATIKDLTNKTLDAVSGYSRLTGLLERLIQMEDK